MRQFDWPAQTRNTCENLNPQYTPLHTALMKYKIVEVDSYPIEQQSHSLIDPGLYTNTSVHRMTNFHQSLSSKALSLPVAWVADQGNNVKKDFGKTIVLNSQAWSISGIAQWVKAETCLLKNDAIYISVSNQRRTVNDFPTWWAGATSISQLYSWDLHSPRPLHYVTTVWLH